MKRREFILLLDSAVAWPLRTQAQEPGRLYRIAFIAQISQEAPQWAEVISELARFGFVEGKNLVLDLRGLGTRADDMSTVTAELINASPDLIYCGGDAAMHAAASATKSIPIVATADDYLATGLVPSLARPGGNLTGISLFAPELNGKRLEILVDLVPGMRHVAVLADQRVVIPKNLQAIEDNVQLPRHSSFDAMGDSRTRDIACDQSSRERRSSGDQRALFSFSSLDTCPHFRNCRRSPNAGHLSVAGICD